MSTIGEKLQAVRKEKKLSQSDVVQQLDNLGLPSSVSQLSKWETGQRSPSLDQFFALCEVYHLDDPLEMFSPFHVIRLNAAGLRKVQEYREDLIASGRYAPLRVVTNRARRLYLLPASAGTGQFLDSDAFENVDLPADVPDVADFGIRVAGDSMEPRIHDGQNVWVAQQESIENGEIGVFYLDGDAYVKKFQQDKSGVKLISLNPKYPPIPVSKNADFRVFGRVVGISDK